MKNIIATFIAINMLTLLFTFPYSLTEWSDEQYGWLIGVGIISILFFLFIIFEYFSGKNKKLHDKIIKRLMWSSLFYFIVLIFYFYLKPEKDYSNSHYGGYQAMGDGFEAIGFLVITTFFWILALLKINIHKYQKKLFTFFDKIGKISIYISILIIIVINIDYFTQGRFIKISFSSNKNFIVEQNIKRCNTIDNLNDKKKCFIKLFKNDESYYIRTNFEKYRKTFNKNLMMEEGLYFSNSCDIKIKIFKKGEYYLYELVNPNLINHKGNFYSYGIRDGETVLDFSRDYFIKIPLKSISKNSFSLNILDYSANKLFLSCSDKSIYKK